TGRPMRLPSWKGLGVGSTSQCISESGRTNDEIRRNTETRTTNGPWPPDRSSTFGLRNSFVICHLSFVIAQAVQDPDACAKANASPCRTASGPFQVSRDSSHRRSHVARFRCRPRRRDQQSPTRHAKNFRVWHAWESGIEKDHSPDERTQNAAGIL